MAVRKEAIPILFLLGFTILIFSPVLFFGRAFAGEEQFGFYYPISAYYQKSLEVGASLLWNGAYYGGVSASLDQFVGAFFPPKRLIFSLFSLFTAHHISVTLGVFLGLLLTYWFGRAQGWAKSSSLIFALGYLSATSYAWLQIGTIAAYSFLAAPGLFLALHQIKERRRPVIYALIGMLSLWAGFVTGFVQIVFYVIVIAGLYALFLDVSSWRGDFSVWRKLSASLGFAFMLLIAAVLGIRQVGASAILVSETIRTPQYALQNVYPVSPIEVLTWVLPDFISLPFLGGGYHGFHVGAIGFVFFLLGLCFYRTKLSLFFLALYGMALGFAFYLPGFGWANTHLPPFSHLGSAARWLVVAAFPISYLAAAGFQQFLNNPNRVRERQNVILWILGIGAALVSLGLGLLSFIPQWILEHPAWLGRIIEWRFQRRPMQFPPEHYLHVLKETLVSTGEKFSLTNPEMAFAMLLWPAAFGFFFFVLRSKWNERTVQLAAVIFAAVNIGGIFLLESRPFILQAIMEKEPELATVMRAREESSKAYRTIGFLIGDSIFWEITSKQRLTREELTILQRELMVNNSNVFWNIEKMDGMEPYRTQRANQLLNTVVAHDKNLMIFDPASSLLPHDPLNRLDNLHVMKRVTLEEKKRDFTEKLPLLSMMSVKYIYSLYPLADKNLAPIPLSSRDLPVKLHLYENKTVLPRIYFSQKPEFRTGNEGELIMEMVAIQDFKNTTLIECQDCPEGAPHPGDTLNIKRYENGLLDMEATTERGRWLVFSESSLPGWEAAIDGKMIPIYRANYLFQAVFVPSGEHSISFRYRDVVEEKAANLLNTLLGNPVSK